MADDGRPDLLIVGGGVAGLTAARRAQQLGLETLVLERHDGAPGFGNGRLSGGWFHAAKRTPATDPSVLYDTITEKTDGHARPDVARSWATNVGRAFRFLVAEGGRFEPLDDVDEERRNALMPQRAARLGRAWQGTGADNLLTVMCRRFTDGGGRFLASHRARELVTERGRVRGVVADGPGGTVRIGARAVLLADGGFQADPALVARYITTAYKLRGSPNDTGDALRMGLEVGAVPYNMDTFYGWPLCEDAVRDDRLWPYPGPLALVAGGALVDGNGRRFVDEGLPGERVAVAIAKSATPERCWAVCDAATWQGPASQGDVPVNPTLGEVGGTVVTASSLEELAARLGVPGERLVAGVRAAEDGATASPGRTGPAPVLRRAPFVAVPVIAGVTFAMGGLLVNGRGEVLDGDERPIPGLYAAGGTMGGLQGGPRSGYSGGWSEASTFGLLVAEGAAGS